MASQGKCGLLDTLKPRARSVFLDTVPFDVVRGSGAAPNEIPEAVLGLQRRGGAAHCLHFGVLYA